MIDELINNIKKNLPNCKVLPASGMPALEDPKHELPADLERFYSICGGIVLFEDQNYSLTIVSPDSFVSANPIIVGDLYPEDRSSDWYIIGYDGSSQYITIDLSNEKKGRCYDSYYDRHGVVGENSVIAESFSELLSKLLESKGENLFWLEEDFVSLGDAYDDDK